MMATWQSLRADLERLGVRPGDLLMVHASLRACGPIVGGAATMVNALLDSIGPRGTLMAYVDFEPFFEDDTPEADIPVFDKRTARAALDHGVLHETLRNWPGALRSDHPDAGVAAIGPMARWLTSAHPFQYGYGEGSPFAKFVEARGRVLMLAAPLDTITLLHYAEHLADIPDKRVVRYRRRMPGPSGPEWVDFEEFDTSEPVCTALPIDCFERIARDFLASGRGRENPLAAGTAHLFEGPELVEFGVDWIERVARR